MESRNWMYNRTNENRGGMRQEFVDGVDAFVGYAMTLETFLSHGLVRCPCVICQCRNYEKPEIVRFHLYKDGFQKDYTVWTSHGEINSSFGRFQDFVVGESSRAVEPNVQNSRMHDMVQDAYGMHSDFESGNHGEEAPNEEASRFFEQLKKASQPLYDGSPHSQLSIAVRLLSIKADWNVPQGAMDAVIGLIHELVDPNLEIPENYYKAKRLVSKLGLSSMRIDCCENGCMLYYKDDEGVETFDVSLKQNFNLRATLMWTINDFPAYGMLSGWMTAGKLACPYCMENTKSFTLKHGKKNSWFDCHRQFLPMDHEFRSMKNAFRKNKIERNYPPPRLSGEEIWERVENFPKVTEEPPYKFDGYGLAHNWTKQSIFWELPYWKDNLLRHNLDVMHIEKNYFDNLFNTVMDVKGKTKDNPKARLDLQEYCMRKELWL
ncbi:uncharacterized protein LOC132045694 [Lycium ferocissimum]|uniref:uncharacterized protein LOC132045694 n=1 Tax=Lycium ferocissimum TaxID=112874 RepID=UPI0028158BA9|nr:uncharacterized protein LOC132045694 [Lycium ferocissimum]